MTIQCHVHNVLESWDRLWQRECMSLKPTYENNYVSYLPFYNSGILNQQCLILSFIRVFLQKIDLPPVFSDGSNNDGGSGNKNP